MFESGEKVLQQIKLLRADHKSHYRQTFVFKKKDLVKFTKYEVNEIRKLVNLFRVKRTQKSEDSQEPVRYKDELRSSSEDDQTSYRQVLAFKDKPN